MNAFVKKEIRLLLPSFLIGSVLAYASVPFIDSSSQHNDNPLIDFLSFIICPAIALFMALNSFGAEITTGNFSTLLAQPISRRKIWQTKTSLLAAALILGGLIWSIIFYFRVAPFRNPNSENIWSLLGIAWLVLLAIYSGALWTVLLLRQVAAAFWFTLLTPGAVAMIILGFFELFPERYDDYANSAIVVALLIYCLAGFWFAQWLFFRAQDTAWTGGTIAMPEIRGLTQLRFSSGNQRRWRPRVALLVKELQLHQSQFIVAGVLLLLHLGVLVTRHFGHFQVNSATAFILNTFWGLWLVLPMLVGCAASAEERKMGTLGGQLCLPVRPRTQFAIKISSVILLSLLFGVVMPLLLETGRILPDIHLAFNPLKTANGMEFLMSGQPPISKIHFYFFYIIFRLEPFFPLLGLMSIPAAIGLISFYASTLSRHTLQALTLAVLGLVLTVFLIVIVQPGITNYYFIKFAPWRGSLIYFIGVPTMAITLLVLACGNFRRTFIDWKVWRGNVLKLLLMLGLTAVTTAAVYHRVWEKLTPFEPTHGVARLSLSDPATLQNNPWSGLSVRLPDGRIWQGYFAMSSPESLLLGDYQIHQWGGEFFYPGSNWVSMVGTPQLEQVGIKTDGTLWVSEKPTRRMENGWGKNKADTFVQFGNATDWRSASWTGLAMLLIKNDGTLWRWGATNWDNNKHSWPGLRTFTPNPLGTASDWVNFLSADNLCFEKTDGSLWTQFNFDPTHQITLAPGFSLGRISPPQPYQWRNLSMLRSGLGYNFGIRDDGTFRLWADQKLKKEAGTKNYQVLWTETDWQFGADTNWLSLAGGGQKMVTLKNDGTLWLWYFYHDNRFGWDTERDEQDMLAVKPVRLGIHSDWIAVTSTEDGIISLAADGSLWFWPLVGVNRYGQFDNAQFNGHGDYPFSPLLDISRKPQFLANVFGKGD